MTKIKNVTEEKEKKKKAQSLTVFLSANKIDNYNAGRREGKKEKNPKESTEQVNK